MDNLGSDSWHSYPKVYALGHANLTQLFFDDVIVEEKIDGSQFSFGVFDGELRCRSRGKQLEVEAPEKMFELAVEVACGIQAQLEDGWTYRAEYLQKPKHNTIAYSRIPENHLMLFDINTGMEQYLDYDDKMEEADLIGLECVPLLSKGRIGNPDELKALLETDSILGNAKIEGLVCKNYARFGRDGKALLGKYVSEAFKEKHDKEWKGKNPGGKDIVQTIGQSLRTDARWEKAIQHLREAGTLEDSPRDIGPLMKELHIDLAEECGDEIKSKLYTWCIPKIKRIACSGFPEWYKERLLEKQFNENE